MDLLKRYWEEKTLLCILLLAFLSRFVAVVFAKGFGMHDDHYLIIEAAQSWVDGTDYNNWLPMSDGNAGPSGHSFFYVGLNYIFLTVINWLGIDNPQIKMFFIRLIHALWSLLVVYFAFKIIEKASDKKIATKAGLLLALLWFFPWISVRNLAEVVAIPFLMWAVWLIYKKDKLNVFAKEFFWAGILLGMAFSIRFQVALFIVGIGIVMILRMQWRPILIMAFGFIASVFILQGIIDWILWGRPFAEMLVYIQYNIDHSNDYIVSSWYTYLLLIGGILLPPVSLFLFTGFVRIWKKYLLLFLPTFVFLLFHSSFPNKQERFVLTVIPFFIIAGVLGWELLVRESEFWKRRKSFIKVSWIIFWSLNFIVMPFISTHYSKKARVESMVYLSKYLKSEPDKLKYDQSYYLMVENLNASSTKLPAEFYLGHWILAYDVNATCSVDSVYNYWVVKNPDWVPRFILFEEDKKLDERVANMKKYFPNIEYETTIEPGFIDNLLYKLNPINANQTITIYRNRDFYPQKIKTE